MVSGRPVDSMRVTAVGFFVLRTPLLAFDELVRLGEGASDVAGIRARLAAHVARPAVREALFVASPVLEAEIDYWLQDPASDRGQKIERSLVRYFCRMTGRATPFGLFSGCSIGRIGAATQLGIEPMDRNRRHTRLDMYYVCELAESIARRPDIRDELVYRPSTSVYRIANQLYYAEPSSTAGSRDYHLSAVDWTPHLDATLGRAQPGALLSTLAQGLVADDPEISIGEARRYIDQLIDAQLLVGDLAPTVTGPESIDAVLTALEARPGARAFAPPLRRVEAGLVELDVAIGHPPASYRRLARELDDLPVKAELPRLFQVDLVKASPNATLGPDVLREVSRAVELLRRTGPSVSSTSMQRFRAAFAARYGEREVPLALALDEENGIGFDSAPGPWSDASPLLRGFSFRQAAGSAAFTARDQHLLRRLVDVWRSGGSQLELTETDWSAIETADAAPLPVSFAVMAQLAVTSDAALARGEFKVLVDHVSGPSAAILVGRFCHADQELHALVRGMLRDEETAQPDAVYAEIVHLPEGRIGNIVSRPVLRDYEIVYLGASGAPIERQLTIDDLTIRIEGERVTLWSQRLAREVIPRLSNAHNYAVRSLGIYRFLCAVQRQGVMAGAGWHWGALSNADRLPRVTSGRIVLAPQRWNIDGKRIAELVNRDGIDRMRAQLRLPRWIAVSDGDNVLPIDLDNPLLVDALAQLLKGRAAAQLVEIFPSPDELCAHSSEGRFVHELVIPFRSTAARAEPPRHASTIGTLPRLRPPGMDWIFAKLFAGPATLDRMLRDLVSPLVAELRATQEPWSWFFIRYGDPDWHLRLRFHGDPAWLHAAVGPQLAAAAQPLIDDGTIWKLQLDTYDRELERYGGSEGMVLSEHLFRADSDAVLAILPHVLGDGGADLRWRCTLLGMDRLLSDLGFPLDGKLAVVRDTRTAFARELGIDTMFERQLGDRFRRERRSLEALLGAVEADESTAATYRALDERSRRIAPIASELRAAHVANRLTTSLADLAASYLHMHANRMLRAAAREQELILYDFLQRLYESQQARARGRG